MNTGTIRVSGPGFATGGWTVMRLRPPFHCMLSDWESLWYCPTRHIARAVAHGVRNGRDNAQIAGVKAAMERSRERRRSTIGNTARYYGNGIRIRYSARFRMWSVQRINGVWADVGGYCGISHAAAHAAALRLVERDAALNAADDLARNGPLR